MTLLEEERETAWAAADRIKAKWRSGAEANTAAALDAEPMLARHRSVVLDLAYEEYLQREKGGAAPDPAQFAREFPDFQASVQNLIEAHQHFLEHPDRSPRPMRTGPRSANRSMVWTFCESLVAGTSAVPISPETPGSIGCAS